MPLWIGQVAFGLVLLVTGIVCWRGFWRGWATQVYALTWVGLIPMLGLAMVLSAPAQVLDPPLEYAFTGPALPLVFFGLYLGVEQPRWYGPRWFKEVVGRNEDWAGRMARAERARKDGRR